MQSLWIIGYITYRLKETISNLTSKNKNIQTNSSKTFNWNREIKNYVDPPNFWNPTLGLFFGGYFLAFLSIWQWYRGVWPLPLLVATAFLALHIWRNRDTWCMSQGCPSCALDKPSNGTWISHTLRLQFPSFY